MVGFPCIRRGNFSRKNIYSFLKLPRIFNKAIRLFGEGIFRDRSLKLVGGFSANCRQSGTGEQEAASIQLADASQVGACKR